MKQIITAALAMLFVGSSAFATPEAEYSNFGLITNAPVIDATIFLNQGVFEPVITLSNVVHGENLDTEAQIPFATHDTLYYTNFGSGALMLGQPGFNFQTFTTSGAHTAASVYNGGTIIAIDAQTAPEVESIDGSPYEFAPGTGVAYPAQVIFQSTNIFNDQNGIIAVGAGGLLQMYGNNITNKGGLVAGNIVDVDLFDGDFGFENSFNFSTPPGDEPFDATSIDQAAYTYTTAGGGGQGGSGGTIVAQYFTAPHTFYDLYWGVTASGTLTLSSTSGQALNEGETPGEPVTGRGAGTGKVSLPYVGGGGFVLQSNIFFGNDFAYYVDLETTELTNYYYTIVAVNTNFTDTNITAQVLFSSYNGYFADIIGGAGPPQPNGEEAIVQFTVPCKDVITGAMTSNSVYVLDGGGVFANTVTIYTNAAWLSDYSRPSWIAISTATPEEFSFAQPPDDQGEADLVEQLVYPGVGVLYEAKSVTYSSASYAVQVGLDPENGNGVFDQTVNLFSTVPDIPDPSQETPRIDLEGNNVNLTGGVIRSEGLVTLLATNLVGGGDSGVDWGMADATIGASSGTLVISNIFPQSFTRVRGDMAMWSGNWVSVGTNSTTTNNYYFHMLVINQAMRGNFHPTVRNLNFVGGGSIKLDDPVTILNQATFQTANLTINSLVHFTENVSSINGTNVPGLKNLLVGPNGDLAVDNVLDLGYNPAINSLSPLNRQYTLASIANFGEIEAGSPLLQAAFFENDGGILSSNDGSITIEAETLDMGLFSPGETNSILANGNITLSANEIDVTNSTLIAGYTVGSDFNPPGTLILQTIPDGQITDFVLNTPTTNNVINNFWQVNDGFSLPVKPATGDLYGTEIKTIATNSTVATHVWAGAGGFANPADGFVDNVVIGHLILSWQSSNALLHFTGVGVSNAMYVDYLEFDQNSLYQFSSQTPTNYEKGLVIDSNLTIYFAGCNFDDPTKLTVAYPGRLVWVTNFAGPNSTRFVTNKLNTSQVCAINASLADDTSQDPLYEFFPPTQNSANATYPLNNPTGGAYYYATCPPPAVPVETITGPVGTNFAQMLSWAQTQTGLASLSGSFTNITNGFTGKQPFADFKGVYNGLFYNTNVIVSTNGTNISSAALLSPTNSGFFTFTLSGTGSFSGRLEMGATNYTFSGSGVGKFSTATGTAQVIAKHGKQELSVNLALGSTTSGSIAVAGTVSNAAWSSQLAGDLDSWAAKNQSPYLGRYTMLLTNGGSNSVSLPGGDSYGTLTINKLGMLSLAGKLADGIAFNQTVAVAEDGRWPFYVYAPGGQDFLLGWVYFEPNYATNATRLYTLTGNGIYWNKGGAPKDPYYPVGFSSTNFDLAAFLYINPGRANGFILPDPTNSMILLDGAGLSLTNSVAYNGKLMYSNANLTLSINPELGSFTGRYQAGKGGTAIKLGGVTVQSLDQDGAFEGAFGFFLGSEGQSGAVILQAP